MFRHLVKFREQDKGTGTWLCFFEKISAGFPCDSYAFCVKVP